MGDAPRLELLMKAAIDGLLSQVLSREQVEASITVMGLDRQLIADESYYLVECEDRIVGSGGWSRRATLFGGDHSPGRDEAELDPAQAPARMRAMYTHPAFARRGIGRFILAHCERCAADYGFRRAALVATMAGLPLYRACGYREVEHFFEDTPSGIAVPLVRMEKSLAAVSDRLN